MEKENKSTKTSNQREKQIHPTEFARETEKKNKAQ